MMVSTCLAFLMHCSPTTTAYQDNSIKPYSQEFIRIGKLFKVKAIESKVRQTKVTVEAMENKNLGKCFYYFNEVIFNKKFFSKLSVENKEELVFHEFGHCILNQIEHSPDGIMRPAGLYNPELYRQNYKVLINKLFGCKTGDCVDIQWDPNKYKSSNKEKQLTKADILNNKHAVVRFTATWCPPCKALAPIFDEVAAAHPDVVVYVVDVDQNQDLARDMNIRGIPTMVQIKDGAVTDTKVGAQPKPVVEGLFK
jgi:thioredoxin 1